MAQSLSMPIQGDRLTFDAAARAKVVVLAIAFVAAFWDLLDFVPSQFGELTYAWLNEMDWSHGPLIPLFSAYLVYLRWDRVRRTPIRGTGWGYVPLLGGLALYLLSWSGVLLFGYAKPVGMMVTLLGVLVLLFGVPMLRHLGVPWLYLFFAVPLPKPIYFALTDPLRRLAAVVASGVLSLLPNLDVQRMGSNLEYAYGSSTGVIGVADACSGMRSTVTLCALGVAVAFMSERPMWQRVVLVLSCVPIATFCNFIRVTVTCWLHIFVDPKYATGTYHMMLGLVVIVVAFGIFSALGWVLTRLFIEEQDEGPAPELNAT